MRPDSVAGTGIKHKISEIFCIIALIGESFFEGRTHYYIKGGCRRDGSYGSCGNCGNCGSCGSYVQALRD